jgi:8-oxo-dGTP pyrophosphatase MutT (NUDIX family)
MSNKIQKTSVKALFYSNDRVLMLKDDKGNWELPGGKLEFGEHPQDTLKRELEEELALNDVSIDEVINVWDFTAKYMDDDYQFVIIVFKCSSLEYKITISDEHTEYKWADHFEIDTLPMKDGYRATIKNYLKNKKE